MWHVSILTIMNWNSKTSYLRVSTYLCCKKKLRKKDSCNLNIFALDGFVAKISQTACGCVSSFPLQNNPPQKHCHRHTNIRDISIPHICNICQQISAIWRDFRINAKIIHLCIQNIYLGRRILHLGGQIVYFSHELYIQLWLKYYGKDIGDVNILSFMPKI